MSNDLTLPPQSMSLRRGLLGRFAWIRQASPDARAIRSQIVLDRLDKQCKKAVKTIEATADALAAGWRKGKHIPLGRDRVKPDFTPSFRVKAPPSLQSGPSTSALKTALTDLIAAYRKWPLRNNPAQGQTALTIQSGLVAIARHLEAQEAASHLQKDPCCTSITRATKALTALIDADNRDHARSNLLNFEKSLLAFEYQPSLQRLGR